MLHVPPCKKDNKRIKDKVDLEEYRQQNNNMRANIYETCEREREKEEEREHEARRRSKQPHHTPRIGLETFSARVFIEHLSKSR